MRRRIGFAALVGLILAGPSIGDAPAGNDPFIGTWELDRSRSVYPLGGMPMKMVVVMTMAESGIHYKSDSTLANGEQASSEYTAEYDGRLALVIGTRGLMTPVLLKRIDNETVEASYMRGSRLVASSVRKLIDHGSTMTITTTSTGRDGSTSTNLGVFTRL